jgi:hypothetical protein
MTIKIQLKEFLIEIIDNESSIVIIATKEGETVEEFVLFKYIYQEEDSSTFIHNNMEYDLNKLLLISNNIPIEKIQTSELSWILKHTNVDKKRVRKSDTSFPLLITFDKAENKWVVLDGAHRLTKAVSENKKYLPVKKVPEKMLEECVLVQNLYL